MMESITVRQIVTNTISFWERGRIIYNVVLAVIVASVFALSNANENLSLHMAVELIVLAVLANIVYCAAYVVDVFVQLSDLRDVWLRRRWVLFGAGLLLASVIAGTISCEMFKTCGT
jgi:hypothetical protein